MVIDATPMSLKLSFLPMLRAAIDRCENDVFNASNRLTTMLMNSPACLAMMFTWSGSLLPNKPDRTTVKMLYIRSEMKRVKKETGTQQKKMINRLIKNRETRYAQHTCTGELPLSTLSMLSPVLAPKNAEMIFKPVVKWKKKRDNWQAWRVINYSSVHAVINENT